MITLLTTNYKLEMSEDEAIALFRGLECLGLVGMPRFGFNDLPESDIKTLNEIYSELQKPVGSRAVAQLEG